MSRISRLRPLRFLAAITSIAAIASMSVFAPMAQAARHDVTTTYTLTVHYYRFDTTYTNWNLWSWVNTQSGSDCSTGTPPTPNAGDGSYPLNGTDSFGVWGKITYTCTSSVMQQAGLIVRQTGWTNREPPGNRYISFPAGQTNVSDWVVSGDPTDYSSLAAANRAKYTLIDSATAKNGKQTVNVVLSKAFKLTPGGQGWKLKDTKTKKTYKATASIDGESFPGLKPVLVGDLQKNLGNASNWDPASTKTVMKQVSPDLYELTATLPASSPNQGTADEWQYKVALGGAWSCGTCASYPGNNVVLQLDGSESVTFYFVPYGDQVYDSINNPVQPLPPSDAGFSTPKVNVVFHIKNFKFTTKDKYTLSGPGVPTGAVTVTK
jgi:hypothetical protein